MYGEMGEFCLDREKSQNMPEAWKKKNLNPIIRSLQIEIQGKKQAYFDTYSPSIMSHHLT